MIAPAFMNNSRLRELIHEVTDSVIDDQPGFWKFEYDGQLVFVITDESHNRMRIICPIVEAGEVSQKEWMTMMSANFDRALDARYCINNETLWSAFIHPLEELASHQFRDALKQVVTLASNFGTSYSSGNLVFGGDGDG